MFDFRSRAIMINFWNSFFNRSFLGPNHAPSAVGARQPASRHQGTGERLAGERRAGRPLTSARSPVF